MQQTACDITGAAGPAGSNTRARRAAIGNVEIDVIVQVSVVGRPGGGDVSDAGFDRAVEAFIAAEKTARAEAAAAE